MAERVVRNLTNDYLMCSICLGRYTDPRLLPCGHTFCKKCLEDHIRETVTDRAAVTFSCPNDRTQISRPSPDLAPKDWATAFPADSFLSSLLNAVMIHAAPSGEENQNDDLVCKNHKGRMKEFYCLRCDVTACPYCVVKNHKGGRCECVGIDEAVDKLRPKMESLRLKLHHQVQNARKFSNSENMEEETLRITKENAMRDLTDFETKLTFFFTTAQRQLEDMKQTILETGTGTLNENQQVAVMIQNITETIDKFDDLCNHGSGAQILDIVKKVDNQTREYDDALNTFKLASAPVQVHFVPNKDMEYVFENIPALGSIAVRGGEQSQFRQSFNAAMSNTPFLATPRGQAMSPMFTPRAQSTTPRSQPFSTRTQSFPTLEQTPAGMPTRRRASQGDTTGRPSRNKISISVKNVNNPAPCWQLTGITFVGDKIVVCDARNNKVRQCVFQQNPPIFQQLTLDCPVSVCSLRDNTDVLVTLPDASQIVLLGTDNTLDVKEEIATQKPYEGICTLDSSELVVSCCVIGKQCIDVIDMSGRVLRTFDKDTRGQPLFSWPRFISTSRSGNIVVSDRDQRSVYCLDPEGTPLWTFVASASPWGISGHESGKLFLCLDNGIVQVLTDDGALIQNKFITKRDGVNIPYAVHAKHDFVTVTEWGGSLFAPNSPWIHIFSLLD